MNPVRCILIGGFLGCGKTAALAALADCFRLGGHCVGCVTNDRGSELVDSAILRAGNLPVAEIPGGSFPGRFDKLVDAVRTLAQGGADRVLAEPVGGCTDLAATVIQPLRQLHGDACLVAPLSVLVDPRRAEQVLGLAPGGSFSAKVLSLSRSQLAEADLIVITKADLLDEARLARLRAKLTADFPQARVLAISARTGLGVREWAALLEGGATEPRALPALDPNLAAEGEALLGWLNATIEFHGARAADPQAVLTTLIRRIQTALPAGEIAHFKIALRPDGSPDVAVIELVQRGDEPEISRSLPSPVETGELILNLRGEISPEALHTAVRQGVVELGKEFPGLSTEFAHLHYFRPGRTVPTHRMAG